MDAAQPGQAQAFADAAPARPPLSAIACDLVCFGFAGWTLLCHAFVLAGGSARQLGYAVLACAAVAVLLLARAARTGRLAPRLAAVLELPRDPVHRPAADGNEIGVRLRALFFFAGCGIAARFYLHPDLQELWVLALVFFAASYVVIAREIRSGPPPAQAGFREGLLWALGVVCAAITLALHRPDTDDAFYGNLAVSVVDFPDQPLLAFDTLHGLSDALQMGAYKAASIELLSGFISRATGLETLVVYHLVTPAFAACLLPLALARLFRLLAGERWAWAVLATVVLLALDAGGGRGSFGAFAFPRLFQGKAMLVTVGVPLLLSNGVRFGLAPSRAGFALLAATQVAAVGCSVTAFWLGPVLAMAGVLVGLARQRGGYKVVLAGVAASGYVLALGAYIALANRGGHGSHAAQAIASAEEATVERFDTLVPDAYAMVLGEGPHRALALAVVLIAWPLCQSPRARRFAVLVPLLFFAFAGNPLLTRFLLPLTTPAIYWRVLWLLPWPLLAGLAASALLASGRARARLSRVPLFALALALFIGFASPGGVALTREALAWPRPKVEPNALRAARALVAELPPRSHAACPEVVCRALAMLNGYSYPILTKPKYLPRGNKPDRWDRLRVAQLLADPKPNGAERRWLAGSLDRYAIDGVAAAAHPSDPTRGWSQGLRGAGFREARRVGGYTIWVRRPAPGLRAQRGVE